MSAPTPRRGQPTEAEIPALLEFSSVINSSLDLPFILDTLLFTLLGKLLVTKGVILLWRSGHLFSVVNGKGVPKSIIGTELTVRSRSRRPFAVTPSLNQQLAESGIGRLYPIIAQDAVIGYFGSALSTRRPADAETERFVQTILGMAATAIGKSASYQQVRSVNRALDGKVHQLKTLFELAKEFGGILDRERLLKMFSLTLMGQVGTSRYAICLKDAPGIYSRINGAAIEQEASLLFATVRSPMLTSDLPKTKKFAALTARLMHEKIAALVPLQLQNDVKGILCLGERLRGNTYSTEDLEFVFSLANLAFVSLENSRLFDEAIEKKKLESELLIAREIQQGLLPGTLPEIPGFDVAAVNISSKQVGGDYYDVLLNDDGHAVIAIGDVSGKGTPASLLMANVQATVHALVPFRLRLSDATARINDLIHRNTGSDKFITFFWGIVDPATKVFRYVNAGHNQPFVLRADGSIERLSEGGLILGIMRTMIPYEEGSVELRSGDAVVMFTDGVSEAMNTSGVDYTEERLEQFILGLGGRSAAEILTAIKNEIQLYTVGAPQSDDITMVVLKAV